MFLLYLYISTHDLESYFESPALRGFQNNPFHNPAGKISRLERELDLIRSKNLKDFWIVLSRSKRF